MPRSIKSLQNLFIETVLFISIFAIVGHVSVNFWERYIIQSELSKMKTSLHSLKDTITIIGDAYDNLNKELKVLAEVAESKPKIVQVQYQLDSSKPQYKSKSTLDRRILHDLEVQAIINNNRDRKIGVAPTTADENTQHIFHQNDIGINAPTVPKYTEKYPLFREKHDAEIATVPVFHSRKTTNFLENIREGKNATTITRYPLKTTGVGKENSINDNFVLNENCKYKDKHTNIHKCYGEEDSSYDLPRWRF